jgi:hypothetical protein
MTGRPRSVSQSGKELVLLLARKISNEANTAGFEMNHGGNVLTHLYIFPDKLSVYTLL